jgi:serine/threonine protein kinase, bacterial
VSELTAASSYATGANFAAAAAAFKNPISIALDGSGNVFAANTDGGSGNFGSVSELTAGSSYATGLDFAPASAAFNNPISIALDGSGNLFVANEIGDSNNGSVSELTAASSYATGVNFAPSGAAFNNPVSIALDGSGNLFAANFNSVSEILGLAKPVITPVQSCLIYWSSHPGHPCVP